VKNKLAADFRRIVASYLRAVATVVGGTQIFDAFGARGWHGVFVSLGIALIAPSIRALEAIATDIEG
jgi:hypothetical protein